MRRPRPPLAVLALLLVLAQLVPGLPRPARGAEYRMETVAQYAVRPDNRDVAVRVEVIFENTTPDPAGQFSVFEVVDLAIHPGAADIAARDGDGALAVSSGARDGFVLVSVRPRQAVRYEQTASFTLTYRLPDGAASGIRIRPSLVAFPAWSFGTGGTVTVSMPAGFEVSVDGNELAAERSDGSLVLTSGEVADPSAWLARIVAIGPASYRTFSRPVPLTSGTVDLRVRAWADDEAWGEATLELLVEALPLLEEAIGLPYPEVGPLTVIESVSGPEGSMGEPSDDGTQVLAGYDQPQFTLLHQAAHVWLDETLASDRWMREGFASYAAGQVAAAVGAEPPYDPLVRRDELADAVFPLVSWGAGEASADQEAFAYAAAWATAVEISATVGDDLQRAWFRITAGIGPYEPVSGEPAAQPPALPARPADSRLLLDQLEAVSKADVAAIFEEWVLDPEAAAALPDRQRARDAFDQLLDAAAGWGAPEPVKVDLAAWRFESAMERIVEARDWLADRDRLLADAEAAGLTVPARLRDRYRTSGGGSDARAELEAEAAVVDDYADVLARSNGERGVLEQIGLLGGPAPAALLGDAGRLFAEGELRGAAEAVAIAGARLEHAATDGVVRVLATLFVVAVLGVLAYRLVGRRRRSSGIDYTAAP